MTTDPTKTSPRPSSKRSEMARALRLILAVTVFVFGLGFVSVENPALFDTEPASAHPTCGGTEGFYHDVCEAALACTNSGGTYSFPTCTYPTTTTPLTPQQQCAASGGSWTIYGCWHQPSCPSGQHWSPPGSVNGSCVSPTPTTTAPPTTTTAPPTTTTTAPPVIVQPPPLPSSCDVTGGSYGIFGIAEDPNAVQTKWQTQWRVCDRLSSPSRLVNPTCWTASDSPPPTCHPGGLWVGQSREGENHQARHKHTNS